VVHERRRNWRSIGFPLLREPAVSHELPIEPMAAFGAEMTTASGIRDPMSGNREGKEAHCRRRCDIHGPEFVAVKPSRAQAPLERLGVPEAGTAPRGQSPLPAIHPGLEHRNGLDALGINAA
jgi:hypothetical protein